MSIQKVKVSINSQQQLASDVYSMWLSVGEIADQAKAGQFISVYSEDESRMLPRPISICEIDTEYKSLRIVYRVVGKGTLELSKLSAGDQVEIMGPLGNGYQLNTEKSLLIAGGIGIPPMLELAKRLEGDKIIVLGYKDEIFLAEEFAEYGTVYIASEDGKTGIKGNVMDVIKAHHLTADMMYSCGPTPMLKAVKAFALESKIKAQLSLEEKMACGVGACLACVCKSKDKDHHTNVHNKRVCKEGPVFFAEEVEL